MAPNKNHVYTASLVAKNKPNTVADDSKCLLFWFKLVFVAIPFLFLGGY